MILGLRTDSPVCELRLLNNDGSVLASEDWQADRTLADNLHWHIADMLETMEAAWGDISGIVVFRGPGSFTGLRIGITVANTIAYANDAPVVGVMGDEWVMDGISRLKAGANDRIVLPFYGSEPRITRPKT